MDLIKRSIMEAFADDLRPDLSTVHPLGCCEEHEQDFEWYRSHSRQEFIDMLPLERLDPADFFTLHPLAYRYFAPGILLATLESPAAHDPEASSWYEREWVDNLIPAELLEPRFRSEYLPLFNQRQRRAVVNHLCFWFDEVLTEPEEPDEMAGRITYNDSGWEIRHGEVTEEDIEYKRRVENAVNQIWPDENRQVIRPDSK